MPDVRPARRRGARLRRAAWLAWLAWLLLGRAEDRGEMTEGRRGSAAARDF